MAHTGALAGNTALRDAWLRGRGAILVEDPVTMFEAAVLLSFGTRLRTNGVAAALQSGGACTLFAEAAGAKGLELPEFSATTKRRLRKALPHFASQNNPLDVTGQAAVETDMFCDALDALAHDPAVGFVAFDAFPPREEGEDVWAEPVLRTARRLRRETGVVFASVAMGALGYGAAGKRFVAGARLPFLQGHRASTGAIRALVDLQGRVSGRCPICRLIRTARARCGSSAARQVRSTRHRARGCSSSTAFDVRRNARSRPRGRRPRPHAPSGSRSP